MSQERDEVRELIETDPAYSNEEFTFTFSRAEVSAIFASVSLWRDHLTGTPRSLCRSVLARIASNEAYQKSKKK